ncbi:uncharacterized protein BO97DRAFT_225301 [Aspergillus homomorphus CBS 101889]|uniref:Uncharacterized protein n=1 Tax=Aspergillus homomorphus (strain CBS 101889) TaxID=1450537 RepID=A0A395HMS7_ASPHC|nr:hypothetical protein BO97DRAFT_225301 [Aspergillus homomorphus CBS 101889]RAL08158.1 hypothetical protein BO97DRAFT_225301 [Aspergillus homomorphus CBS 101889]
MVRAISTAGHVASDRTGFLTVRKKWSGKLLFSLSFLCLSLFLLSFVTDDLISAVRVSGYRADHRVDECFVYVGFGSFGHIVSLDLIIPHDC